MCVSLFICCVPIVCSFAAYPEFLSGYFGLSRFSFFREFPGASSYDLAALVSYDFTQEDWCLSATAGAAGGVQYSPLTLTIM